MLKKDILLLEVMSFLQSKYRLDRLTLTKILFLIKQEVTPAHAFYSFYPYKFGPFSSKLYADLEFYSSKNMIDFSIDRNSKSKSLKIHTDIAHTYQLSNYYKKFIQNILDQCGASTESLVAYVYAKYPEYTLKSEWIQAPILQKQIITPGIFLIGYEGLDIDCFLDKLIRSHIDVLVDVRYNPNSMKYDFNKGKLQKYLTQVNIEYVHLKELGIPGQYRKELKSKSDYLKLFEEYKKLLKSKTQYLNQIEEYAKNKRVCLLCFEKNSEDCHRGEIGKYFSGLGNNIISL